METLAPIYQRAAEFGVTAFLLVVVLTGTGYALYKVGNKLVDVTAESFRRQADATEKTADAVTKIGDLVAAIHVQNEHAAAVMSAHAASLGQVHGHVSRHTKAIVRMLSVVCELAHEQPERVRHSLEEARRLLDGE